MFAALAALHSAQALDRAVSSFPLSRLGVERMDTFSKMLTPPQVAALAGVKVNTLAKKRVAGGGCPFVKVGGAVRYREDDVARYLAARRSSTSDLAAA